MPDIQNKSLANFKRWDAIFIVLLVLVHGAAFYAVSVHDMRYLLFGWVAYECLLLFTHLPFPFSRTLYRIAAQLYGHANATLYWGMEIASTMLALATVGAPSFILLNALAHGSFLLTAYKRGADHTREFYNDPKKTLRINAIMVFDSICHMTCLWCYLRFVLGDAATATTVAVCLVVSVGGLTGWYHRDDIRLAHFVHYLKQPLG